jgi:hypothetical protein
MKKIFLILFAFLFISIFCFSNPGSKSVYAQEKEKIFSVAVLNGQGAPNWLYSVQAIDISGNYAFAVKNFDRHLSVFNISDPSNPVIASAVELPCTGAIGIFISGNYAFIDGEGAFLIYDISNPAVPILKSQNKAGAADRDPQGCVFVQGTYAYVVNSMQPTLSIIDVSNVNAPVLVGTISGEGPPSYLWDPYCVTVNGDYAYVASMGKDALSVFNISDPKKPVSAGVIKGKGDPNFLSGPSSVFIDGNYAYVTSVGDSALSIIDISDPSNPTIKGAISGKGQPNYLGRANDVEVINKYAFVAAGADHTISVFDVIDPANPKLVDVIKGEGSPPDSLNDVRALEISGNYLYAVAFTGSFSIFDISGFTSKRNDPNNDTTDNGNVSILRQWLRIHNPYSI